MTPMKPTKLDRRALLVVLSAAAGTAADARAQVAQSGLDGDWEGELTSISGPGLAPPPQDFGTVRMHIDRRNVRVFIDQAEVKPGTFVIEREGASAVISSLEADPGAPVGTSWIETWTFVVTLGGPDSLLVNFVRVVNNTNMRASQEGARFSQIRTGELRRLRRDVR